MSDPQFLLAIDPGLDTGFAVFSRTGRLLVCGVGHPPVGASFVLIEKPQVYRGRQSKGDPNDLITLAIQLGGYKREHELLSNARVALVLPRVWKGTIPKEIHHPRILGSLSEPERGIVDRCGRGIALGKVHNMMDAVGLGCWAFTQKNLFPCT